MTIPKLHYISQGKTPKEHIQNIQRACSSGAELIQLRLKNTEEKTVLETALEAKKITAHFQTRLIINDYYKIAKAVKADGVHLGKNDTNIAVARKHLETWQIIGGTANTIQDCQNLINNNVDYIGLGPFRFTKTKEKLSPILGINGYLTIIENLKTIVPIIAIGGITINDVSKILETGIYGIAASGEITNNFNNISKFNKLLNSPSNNEQVWNVKQNR